MRSVRVANRTREVMLGRDVKVAESFLTRLRGLLWRPPLQEGQGLLLIPSRGVHMYGMKTALDVVFLDDDKKVCAVYEKLEPGQRTKVHREAWSALELPTGTVARTGTKMGDHVELVET